MLSANYYRKLQQIARVTMEFVTKCLFDLSDKLKEYFIAKKHT